MKYHEYERRIEPQFKKQIVFHLNKLYSEVTVRPREETLHSQATYRSSSSRKKTLPQDRDQRRKSSRSWSKLRKRRRLLQLLMKSKITT